MSAPDEQKAKVIRLHDPSLRPGERPEAEESPAEGGGSQGASEPGERGTRSGGVSGADDLDDPRGDAA